MSRHHYGALAAVIVGFIVCRALGFPIADVAGAIGGHTRAGDVTVGVLVAAAPFAVLVFYSVMRLTHRALVLQLPVVRGVLVLGWLAAGGVMGLLPYSRMGTELKLRTKEAHSAPGFLHGMDMTILAGLAVTVALLLLALHNRPDHSTGPVEWLEHQIEDQAET
ncbi:MAG: hypothetical protein ACYDEN_11150 [Acidimicrobiales bacterium]